jgi:Zn-dependent peptidase ImmA (M78 family)
MISFTNAHNIQLFQDFINRESNSIILRDKNDSFRVILPDDYMSGIFNPDEYVSINGNYIYYNEARCNEIELTDEERFSCIAHELGHYYDETEKNEYNGKIREMNADRFAVSLELGEHLLSVLNKFRIIFDGNDRERIDERINNLQNILLVANQEQ